MGGAMQARAPRLQRASPVSEMALLSPRDRRALRLRPSPAVSNHECVRLGGRCPTTLRRAPAESDQKLSV
jgi:hypothetical protein